MFGALFMSCVVSIAAAQTPPAAEWHVAANGNDQWSGRLAAPNDQKTDGPFATLERARDEIRKVKNNLGRLPASITVWIRGGDYHLDKTFQLVAEDSGSETMPIAYRAYKDEKVRLLGGKRITEFGPVTDREILDRLEPAARGKVRQADLKAAGVTDFGDPVAAAKRIELFFGGKPMQLSRWPNEGFTKIADVVGGKPIKSHGKEGDLVGKFTYEGDRPKRWTGESDIWLHGYWFWDWADAYQKVESIDTDKRVINLVTPYHHYGYRKEQRYYAINLLSEIDSPGEWYVDRKSGTLYFWPPADMATNETYVSLLGTAVSMDNVTDVTFRGLVFEYIRGTAIAIKGGKRDLIAGCTLRNTGGRAVTVDGGEKHGVAGCDIYDTGDGGISLNGGDRAKLIAGEHYATNNHIHRYSRNSNTYRTAVSLAGVGCRAANNLIHDAPHMALGLSGNEHVIELNEVHHVVMETDDAGAFYMGRDWTWRGNVIRHNYFHHIGEFKSWVGTQAIYLDDWASDVKVYGNICHKVFRAVLVGGGRDNTVENNILVDCNIGIHVDSRGLGWAKYYFDQRDNTLIERLNAIPYRDTPWSTRYPQLLTLYQDEPALAKYNKLVRNVMVGCAKPIDLHDKLTDKIVTLQDNSIDEETYLKDGEANRFQLKPDSPMWAKGFQRIPVEKIGLQKDEYRPVLPTVD